MLDEKGGHAHTENKDSKYPVGCFVDLCESGEGDKIHLRLRCTLKADGTVNMVGDAELIEGLRLKDGIIVNTVSEPTKVTPQDGVRFLIALKAHFSSPYLFATEIKSPEVGAQ
ncbi:MAG: hypothetical protein WCT11_04525 [Candidatus Magasanikbacteria bacterium]|jgi:hypothetical protein